MRSWLGACDSAVKLGVTLLVSLTTFALFEPWPLLAAYLAALLAVWFGARMRLRTLLFAQVPFALFGVGLVLVNSMTRPGAVLVEVGGVRFTADGLNFGVALAVRAMLIGTVAIGFMATTEPRALMTSLMQHVRLSPRYAFALLAGHRMLVSLPRTWATIRAAHLVRAPTGRRGQPILGVRGTARCAFALLVTSIRSSERIALALETRGLGAGERTAWRPAVLGHRDLKLAAASILGLAALVAATIAGSPQW